MNQAYFKTIADFGEKNQKRINQQTRRFAIALLNSIVRKTPVDTGRARASWNIVSGFTPDLSVASADKSSIAASGFATARSAATLSDGDTFVISNNLPYIVPLENGSSKQARAGMVRVSIAELQARLRSGGTI